MPVWYVEWLASSVRRTPGRYKWTCCHVKFDTCELPKYIKTFQNTISVLSWHGFVALLWSSCVTSMADLARASH